MTKRTTSEPEPPAKRIKLATSSPDRLSSLSDELLLRILSHLPVHDLATAHRVTKRIREIAGDSQLWRTAYYDRFVRPRLTRIRKPSPRFTTDTRSRRLKWLDETYLLENGRVSSWKKQFKLRHNWSTGLCETNDITVSETPSEAPLLAKLHNGIIYTVGREERICAWSYRSNHHHPLANHSLRLNAGSSWPVCIALDITGDERSYQQIAVGFSDGMFGVYGYDKQAEKFNTELKHRVPAAATISAISYHCPYLLCMTDSNLLHLYSLDNRQDRAAQPDSNKSSLLTPMSRLRSHSASRPLSIGLRIIKHKICATIAYCAFSLSMGWTVGIQEIWLSLSGEIVNSRTAIADGQGFSPLSLHPKEADLEILDYGFGTTRVHGVKPVSPSYISYSHPYLLLSHSDNTMTIYLVASDDSGLSISRGRRLWGHTSSIFEAQVGPRGKAVSISNKGDEVRVWELERSVTSRRESNQLNEADFSVRIVPRKFEMPQNEASIIAAAIALRGSGLGLARERANESMGVTRGWVGFDDENVVVLREQRQGIQALRVYDFT